MNISINKIPKLFFAFILIILASTIIISQLNTAPDEVIYDISYSNKNKIFFEKDLSNQNQKIKISFDFKYSKYQNHDNLFEIKPAPGDDKCCTIRMEFGKNHVDETGKFPNVLALVIGGNDLVGTIITRDIELDETYNISVFVDSGRVRVKFNNEEALVNQHKNLGNKFSRLNVGYGFNKERYFNGDIYNLNLEIYDGYTLWQKILNLLLSILILGSVIYIYRNTRLYDFINSKFLSRENQIELKLNIILIIIIIGFIISIIYKMILIGSFNISYAQNIPYLFNAFSTFGDFFTNYDQSKLLETYWNKENVVRANYFPFAYLLTYPLTLISSNFGFNGSDIGLFVFLFTTFSIAFLIIYYHMNKLKFLDAIHKKIISAAILTITNYGFLFCFDRANYEIILYIILAVSLIFLVKNKVFNFIFLVVLAAMIKPYAAIYSLLLINIYQIKKSIIYYVSFTFLFVTMFIFMLSLFSGPFINNLQTLVQNLNIVNNVYSNNFLMYYSLSILEPIKYLHYFFNCINVEIVANVVVYTTLLSSGVLFFTKDYLWKKVALLTCLIICLTPISFDYKLILFMLPILLFINSNEEESTAKNIIYALLFGLILIPKDFYYFVPGDGLVLNNFTSISVIINPILIYTLTVFLFFDMFKYVKNYFSHINYK